MYCQSLLFSCLLIITPLSVYGNSDEEEGADVLRRYRRVIGGQSATDGQWPWLVSLQAKIVTKRFLGIFPIQHKMLYCGGSVLNDRWILTAAHCFKDPSLPDAMKPKTWHVRLAATSLKAGVLDTIKHFFGRLFRRSDWQQWNKHADRIIIHPNYNPSKKWENDIALVHLRETVPSGPNYADIQRIELPTALDSAFPTTGQDCVTKGWGCTRGGGSVSQTAMSVQLGIKEESSCRWRYGVDMTTRLCVGTQGKGICQGDSGGPLVCKKNGRWIQTGIASFVHSKRPDLYPSVFTRVSHYTNWIKQYIRT